MSLLEERVAAFDGATRRQLVGLLPAKNGVEYEDRLVRETEAIALVDSARRLYRWAHGIVRPGTPPPVGTLKAMLDGPWATFEREPDDENRV